MTNKQLSRAATTAQHEIELVRQRHEQRQRESQVHEAGRTRTPARTREEKYPKNDPVHLMPLVGNVEARIWRNEGANGPYHTVRLFRFYSSGDGQREAGSFRYQDLTHAMVALARAKRWIRREERRRWWE
jgi:hypothetical protein